MLEDIRKYTGLFIVILVLIFVGLVFWGDGSGSGPGSGPVLIKSDIGSFSLKDLQKDGDNHIRLAERVSRAAIGSGNFNAYSDIGGYLIAMGAQGAGEDEALKKFIVNRSLLKQAIDDFGLHASQEEIERYQKEALFTTREGTFDDSTYSEFTDQGLKGLGLNINDLNSFVGEIISFRKLSELLGAGIQGNTAAAEENYLAESQSITLVKFVLSLANFKEGLEPSEEELKTFWEENRGLYQSLPRRKLTYVSKSPDFGTALEEKKNSAASLAAAAESEESTEEGEEKKDEAVALTPIERRKLTDELATVFDDLWVEIQQKVDDGADIADLETLAKEYDLEVKTTELINADSLPQELKGSVRGLRGQTMQSLIMETPKHESDPMKSLSDPLGTGTDSWVIFRVDEAEEPSELSFEDAKEKVKSDFIDQDARKALTEKLPKIRDAVSKALVDEEKPLAEVAKEHGLQTTTHADITNTGTLPGEPTPRDLFRIAAKTAPGEVSEAEVVGDRGLFVRVRTRSFQENDQTEAATERAVSSQQQTLRTALVQHWFQAKFNEANVDFVDPS